MSSSVRSLACAELVRVWSTTVHPIVEAPLQDEAVEKSFRDQLDCLIDALGQVPFLPEPAAEVGAHLVTAGFTGDQVLGQTIQIVGQALIELDELRTVDGLAAKVITLLGALASGYTAALHQRHFEHSEARFQEVFGSAPVGMAISRLDGTVTRTNCVLTEILPYPRAQLTGRDIGELFHRDDAPCYLGLPPDEGVTRIVARQVRSSCQAKTPEVRHVHDRLDAATRHLLRPVQLRMSSIVHRRIRPTRAAHRTYR